MSIKHTSAPSVLFSCSEMGKAENKSDLEKNSYASMESWDNSWKRHHLPMWAKKAIRLNAIKRGAWVSAARWGHTTVESLLPQDLFDHWGSVKRGNTRALIAQPYGNHDDIAAKFATELG